MVTGRREGFAIVAAVALSVASCEALVGIREKELAQPDAAFFGDASMGQQSAEAGGRGEDGARGSGDGKSADQVAESIDANMDAATPVDDGGDGGTMDAGGDAAVVTDPDVPCAQQPSFLYCNDFDSVASVGETWDFVSNTNSDGGAAFRLDLTAYVSPPRSLQVIAPPVASNVLLGKDVGTLYTGCRLAFDLRLDESTLAGIPVADVAQVYLKRATDPLQINFMVGPGAASGLSVHHTDADGGPDQTLPFGAPTLMGWTRIVIVYDSTAGVSVNRDGQLLGTVSVGPGAPGDTMIVMGDAYVSSGGTQTLTTEEDNIVITGH